jgi:hypothetical protein
MSTRFVNDLSSVLPLRRFYSPTTAAASAVFNNHVQRR